MILLDGLSAAQQAIGIAVVAGGLLWKINGYFNTLNHGVQKLTDSITQLSDTTAKLDAASDTMNNRITALEVQVRVIETRQPGKGFLR